jgi:hypothetical protein
MLKIKKFINDYYSILTSIVLGLVSIGFFLGIDNKLSGVTTLLHIDTNFILPKYIATFFALVYTSLSLVFSLIKKIPTQDKQEITSLMRFQIKITIWIQSVLFALSSFLYYTTVKKSIIPIEINLQFLKGLLPPEILSRVFIFHTGYIFILLIILGFFVNKNLFGKNKMQFFFLWAQNMIFAVLGFGFMDTLDSDRSNIRNFTYSYLSFVANINPIIWVFLSICAIAFISVTRLRQKSLTKNIAIGLLFVFLMCQFVTFIGIFENVISYRTFGYWHKSLFLTVFWSMIFYPIATIIRNNDKENFIQKTWLSFGYHLFIFAVGLLLALI